MPYRLKSTPDGRYYIQVKVYDNVPKPEKRFFGLLSHMTYECIENWDNWRDPEHRRPQTYSYDDARRRLEKLTRAEERAILAATYVPQYIYPPLPETDPYAND